MLDALDFICDAWAQMLTGGMKGFEGQKVAFHRPVSICIGMFHTTIEAGDVAEHIHLYLIARIKFLSRVDL
ncbi:MAG: hypothetical protein ABW092_17570 [Candidatus Thiodiazotropha sp.]